MMGLNEKQTELPGFDRLEGRISVARGKIVLAVGTILKAHSS